LFGYKIVICFKFFLSVWNSVLTHEKWYAFIEELSGIETRRFLFFSCKNNVLLLNFLKKVLLISRSRTVDLHALYIERELVLFFFFFIRENLIPWNAYFVGSGEEVKLWLFQVLTRDAYPDLNSRPAVQILNFLSSRYALYKRVGALLTCKIKFEV